jgi:hypothetical protein
VVLRVRDREPDFGEARRPAEQQALGIVLGRALPGDLVCAASTW